MSDVTIERKNKTNKPVIQELTLVSPNRNRKDVGKLKEALERAESIYTPSRTQLYDLYHDVVTIDGHLSGIISKRIDAVTNKHIVFTKNKKKIDELDDLIQSEKFNKLVENILLQKIWGVTGIEFIVGKEFDYNIIPRKHIRTEKNCIVKSQYDFNGISIDDLPMVWVIGGKYDFGKLLQCSMYALYKRSGFGDFAQYVEIFGQPVRIIYYDAYDTKTKDELRKTLNESGSSLAMMIPKQAQFQMLDGKTSNGNGELQEKLIKACNDEMSIAILGNTETTSSSSSSGYAQSVEHGKQQLEITKSDLRFVQNMLNSTKFLWILQSFGFPVEGGKFEFGKELDLSVLKQRLEIDDKVSSKVPVADDYWYETYGIPKPNNYDELKAQQEEQKAAIVEKTQGKQPSSKKTDTEDDDVKVTKKEKNLIDRLGAFFFGSTHEISLSDLYSNTCSCCGGVLPDLIAIDEKKFEKIYEDIARKLIDQKLQNGEIHQDLYFETANMFLSAINEGLQGSTFDYNDSRNVLKSYLTRNIYHFSAAKSLTELIEFRNLMYDKKTKEILQYNEFKKRLISKGKLFNDTYLRTEYDTALQSTIMAYKWDSVQAEYLEYSTVKDSQVRPEHAILDGKTFPKSDSFWNKYYPPLSWNCRCTVVPGMQKNYKEGDYKFTKKVNIDPYFSNNVGKTRVIFNTSHPYFQSTNNSLPKLSWKQYGLWSEDEIRSFNLPQIKESTIDDFYKLWNSIEKYDGDNIVVKDRLGNSILFDSWETNRKGKKKNYFKEHIFTKEDRSKYASEFINVIKYSDEIWDDGKVTHYIKFYKNHTLDVVVNNNNLKAESIYSTTSQRTGEIRAGILKLKSR